MNTTGNVNLFIEEIVGNACGCCVLVGIDAHFGDSN